MEHALTTLKNTKVSMLNNALFTACKELIDDAKQGCVDLVFKEICLEILARARNILPEHQFKELSTYAAEKIEEKNTTGDAELKV